MRMKCNREWRRHSAPPPLRVLTAFLLKCCAPLRRVESQLRVNTPTAFEFDTHISSSCLRIAFRICTGADA